jgi:hypothetical protein
MFLFNQLVRLIRISHDIMNSIKPLINIAIYSSHDK